MNDYNLPRSCSSSSSSSSLSTKAVGHDVFLVWSPSDCRTISDERLPLRLPLRLPGGTQPTQPTRSSDRSDGVKSETSQQADAWADLDVFSRNLIKGSSRKLQQLRDSYIYIYVTCIHIVILCYTPVTCLALFDIRWHGLTWECLTCHWQHVRIAAAQPRVCRDW